jgi:hypothetical protein
VYLDDILIASNNKKQHLKDLKELFTLLSINGLIINITKCRLGVEEFSWDTESILKVTDLCLTA